MGLVTAGQWPYQLRRLRSIDILVGPEQAKARVDLE
jgi:hypothetical protein